MKKLIIALLTITILALPSNKTHAIVGVATGNAPMPLAGLASPALGYAGVFVGAELGLCHEFACLNIFGLGIIGGLVLLDEEQASVSFEAIDESSAKEMGITKREIRIYNSELDEINAVFQEVSNELDESSTIENSRQLWQDYSEYLSPETYKVMTKLK